MISEGVKSSENKINVAKGRNYVCADLKTMGCPGWQ